MSTTRFMLRRISVIVVGLILLQAFAKISMVTAAEYLNWDPKKRRVSANFRDWPLERALTDIAAATKWQVKIPEDSGVTVSGTFKDLKPSLALKHMFGHLNYAVFSSPKGGKPRLQIFLLSAEAREAQEERANKKATPAKKDPFNRSAGTRANYADVMKRFDKNGDGLISNAERLEAQKALSGGNKK